MAYGVKALPFFGYAPVEQDCDDNRACDSSFSPAVIVYYS